MKRETLSDLLHRALRKPLPQNAHKDHRGRCVACHRLVAKHFTTDNRKISCGAVIAQEKRS